MSFTVCTRPFLCFSISSSIALSNFVRCLLLPWFVSVDDTFSFIGMPRSIHPRDPIISCKQPSLDKHRTREMFAPCYFSSFHPSTDHSVCPEPPKISSCIWDMFVFILPKEKVANLQISLRKHTLLTSLRRFQPISPSSFGQQTSTQDSFFFQLLNVGPDNKNAEHKLSISWRNFLGNMKAMSQNLSYFQ